MSNATAEVLQDKHLRLWGIPLSVAGLLFSQMPIFFPGRWDLLWKYMVISIPYATLIWEASRWFLIRLRRRYPALEQTRERAIGILLTFGLVAAIGQMLITGAVMALKLEAPMWVSPLQTWLTNFACSLFFIVVIGGLYEAKYFFGQYKDALQKAEHLKKQQAQQQLDTLKSRVNPHFLFNSLTTLSALIGEDAPSAERFVDELAKVYRYLLRAGRQPMATLGEELQFADAYLFLLKTRFEDGAFSLHVHRQSGGHGVPTEMHLPALALQNALDYLVRTQNTPLRICVEVLANNLLITCENRPKTLAFDVPDNDWAHLENNGAARDVHADQLQISIPFTSTIPSP